MLQQKASAAQTQASHLHPGHPGPSLAWQPVQMPQSWGQLWQSSMVALQVLSPQTAALASEGGGVPVSVGGVPVSVGGGGG